MASITKRGNTYRIRVLAARDASGKQIMESTTFTPDPQKTEKQNQKDLEKFVLEFEQKVKNGKYLDGEKVTFEQFSEIWLHDYAEVNLAPSTVQMYKDLLRVHIVPEIGKQKLSRLQPRTLTSLYRKLLQKQREDGKGTLSPTTVKHVHATISTIYNTAVRWNICLENPCDRTEPPRKSYSQDIKYFTEEQTAIFLNILDKPMVCPRKAHTRIDDTGKPYYVGEYIELQPISTQHKLFFYMALFLGCRRGELIALQWRDIDFEKKTVSITKSTGCVNRQIITKEPKNKTSIREIAIPDVIIRMLKAWQREQKQEAFKLGSSWEGKLKASEYDDNYLFIQWNGTQMHPSTPYHVFRKIISRYNAALPEGEEPLPLIPLHGLRHTSATLLISQNVDVRTVSSRLGHAQTSTTMNIYAHSLKKMDERAADTLENLLIKSY